MKAYKLRVVLRGVEPEVSRVFMLPAGITFLRLHEVVQMGMGWQNYHLHEFTFEGLHDAFTDSEEQVEAYQYYRANPVAENPEHQRWVDRELQHPCRLSSKVKIDKYFETYCQALYVYDFGDFWEHDVVLEETVYDYPYPYPQCLELQGPCPPEDVGGALGYEDFLKAWKRPSNRDKRELVEWGKGQGYTGETVDLETLNHELSVAMVLKRSSKKAVSVSEERVPLATGVFIQDLTFEQVDQLVNEDTIVMLPIGGGSKEHGNHLPMGTDYFVTDWVARQVTGRFPLVCLPTLPYAHFPAFVDWKGSVSVEATNFINFVKDILLSFVRFGVKKFVILDGGVSTRPPMIILATMMNNDYGVKVAVTNVAGLGKEVHDQVCQQQRGGHGDESETSCMLYINDTLVRMDRTVEEYAEVLPGTIVNGVQKVYVPMKMSTPTGTNGNSTLASKSKGEKILNAMVVDLLVFLEGFAKAEF